MLEPTSVIKANLGLEPNGRVQKFFTNTCKKHMDKYVPKDTGTLRNTAYCTADKIVYVQNYAEDVYNGRTETGRPIVNWTTPGTGPYWDKKMVSAEIDQVIKEVQDYVGRQ